MRVRSMRRHVLEQHTSEEIILYTKDFREILLKRFKSDVLFSLFLLWWC